MKGNSIRTCVQNEFLPTRYMCNSNVSLDPATEVEIFQLLSLGPAIVFAPAQLCMKLRARTVARLKSRICG